MKTIKKYVSEQNMDLESFMLAKISPDEASKLSDFIRVHIPFPKSLNYEMTLEESNDMAELLEKLQTVLSCMSMSLPEDGGVQ